MTSVKSAGIDVQTSGEEVQEEVKLVDGAIFPGRFWMSAATQVEQQFAGAVEQFGHDAQVVHGHGPGDVVWGQDAGGDQYRCRGRDAGQIFEPDRDRVYLADTADVDPLAVIQPYPLVGDDALTKPRGLISRMGHDVA